jgi:uncharacterized protein YbaP (TraB family)
MKFIYKLFPFLLLFGCGASTDTAKKNSDKTFKEAIGYDYRKDDKSLLWEITGNGLKQPSFLYGTIHLPDKRVFAFDKTFLKVFDTCAAYAMELDIADINKDEMLKSLKLEKPLIKLIPIKKFLLLDSLLRLRTGKGIKLEDDNSPFLRSSELLKAFEHNDMLLPLDLDLYMKAKGKGKKCMGIEKLQEQLDAIKKMTVEEQTDMLIEGLKEWDKSKEMFNSMIEVYLKQDLAKLMEMTKDTTMPSSFETALLEDRNIVMAERIDAIVKAQPTFNAIGAAHLYGDKGVIALLRKRGYTVKPVKIAFKKSK